MKRTSITFDNNLLKMLKAKAGIEDKTISQIVELALQEYLPLKIMLERKAVNEK